MGYEYRLTFAGADPAKTRQAIGQLPGVEDAARAIPAPPRWHDRCRTQ